MKEVKMMSREQKSSRMAMSNKVLTVRMMIMKISKVDRIMVKMQRIYNNKLITKQID